jgi:hypothetical protein
MLVPSWVVAVWRPAEYVHEKGSVSEGSIHGTLLQNLRENPVE